MGGDGWPIAVLEGHRGEVNDVSLCPSDPLRLVSGGDDGCVRLWTPQSDPIQQEQCGCGWLTPQSTSMLAGRARAPQQPLFQPEKVGDGARDDGLDEEEEDREPLTPIQQQQCRSSVIKQKTLFDLWRVGSQ